MDVDEDNERHRREEQERRAKRKAARESKSESQTEKERKRREHAQRILQAQRKPREPPSAKREDGGSSAFQSLFRQRAEGFLIDLKFRNAPPRPPVGPCFVGLGLEGELTDKWTKYKARNAVERQYVWKLHAEPDLGVPLAVSAMDWEGCYTDPDKKSTQGSPAKAVPSAPPALHPDDEALLNWKGSMGDTASELLQQKRDRARAAARLAVAQGHYGAPLPLSSLQKPTTTPAATFKLKKKHHLQSRILDEKTPNFMKKTTYLTNTAESVHRFTSLAQTQDQRARDVDRAVAETKSKYTEMDVIERGFGMVNSCRVVNVVEGSTGEEEEGNKKKKRVHPTKKDVFPVWDLPLLPDVPTWGYTYTHVVLDNPPKSIKSKKDASSDGNSLVNAQQLQRAIVADVTQQTNNARMACTVWVPSPSEEEPPSKKRKGDAYSAVQRYDLDVVPLRDASAPPVHFVLVVDPRRNYVGYHPVGSRVQLSTGRPVVLGGASAGGGAEIATDKSLVVRRSMEADEKKEAERRMAEVDVDLAEKYGLVEEEGGSGRSGKRKERESGGTNSSTGKKSLDEEDVEEDAF